MRVLLTTDTVGGVWAFNKELASGLLERGHAVALVSLGRELSESQRAWTTSLKARYGASFRFAASCAPLEWMEKNESAYSDSESLMLRMIQEFEVDLVHASQFCFGALPTDRPKVLTAHSDVLSWAEACRTEGLANSTWLRHYHVLVKAGFADADAVVAPTKWMRNALTRHFPASLRAQVILNGRTLANSKGIHSRQLQAVTVGRIWDEGKGLAVLNEVNACMPVMVVGEARFEGARAPELSHVRFLGRLNEDEVLQTLRSSALYLTTSIYEPFGLAPLEAALCGCGVVARDIASLREVWGNAAVYFEDGYALGDLMSRLRDSPSELQALQRRSMGRALELSAGRMVEAYLALYARLVTAIDQREEVAAYAS